MRLLLNIIWFVLAGLWMAIACREIVSVDQARAMGLSPDVAAPADPAHPD